ncbi:MAG: HAD-IA family hydrolase [Clostridia bacterium]|nr:HAD-IA family hydrolase [Clostridia bacterium]
MIKAVLFDLDGTLVNSIIDLSACANYALKEFGFLTHETEEYKYFVGNGIPKMIERALPSEHRNSETIEKVKDVFLREYSVHYADNTASYDGVKQLLCELKAKGMKIAVVTNKAQEMANKVVINAFGDMFDIIFGKRDGIPSKPDPTAALTVMKEFGVKPNECVFIGDSGVDVMTGYNSGAVAVGHIWGYRDEKELRDNKAEYVIENPMQLLDIIKEKS